MKSNLLRLVLGTAVLAILALASTAYAVRERHTAVVTRFGELLRIEDEPGLRWKLPWPIDRVTLLDGRRRILETRQTELLTRDRKNVVLLTFAAWRIDDALLFFQSVGDEEAAERKLDGLVTSTKVEVLGRYDLSALVSTDPETLRGDAIEAELLAGVRAVAAERYGIAVEEVGFKRLSLPEANIPAVLDQMAAERAKVAAGFRAEGEAEAARLRSETDLEVARITSAADEEAARLIGEADAEAARIEGAAQALNPELFLYLRSLESLEALLGSESSLILRTDKAPFSVLNGPEAALGSPLGGPAAPPGAGPETGPEAGPEAGGDGE